MKNDKQTRKDFPIAFRLKKEVIEELERLASELFPSAKKPNKTAVIVKLIKDNKIEYVHQLEKEKRDLEAKIKKIMIKLMRQYKNHALYRVHKDLISYAQKLEDVEATNKDNEFKIINDSASINILETISDRLKVLKFSKVRKRGAKVSYSHMEQGSNKWLIERTKYITSTASRGEKAIDEHALRMAIIEKYGLEEELYLESSC